MRHRDSFVRGVLVALVVAFGWLGAPGAAEAQECSKAAIQTADQKFNEADTAYTLAKWDEAIKAFEGAFEACPNQWHLYGMAQAYRKKDDCKMAIFFYKRYLAFAERDPKNRREDIEGKVKSIFIPELEGKCKDVRSTPPDDVTKPPKDKPPVIKDKPPEIKDKPPVVKDKPPVVKDKPPEVAVNDDDDGDDDGDDDDDDDDDDVGGVTMAAPQAKTMSADVELGAALLTGLGDGVNVPAQFSLRISGGYPLNFGKVELVLGGLFGYTPVPWEANGMSGTTSLISLLANASVGYPIIPKLNFRGELGMGGQFWGGLAAGNPFTMDFAEASGALGMFNLRFAVGAEYLVTRNIMITATPFGLAYSPAPSGMRPDMSSVTRIEFMVGAGYKM